MKSWPLACVGACAFAIVGCSAGDGAPSSECVGEGSAALNVCAPGPTLKGVDVSGYQGSVGWAAVKSSGHAFAFVRVSDGINYPDSTFAGNWSGTKSAGVLRGAYQFFRPGQDPTQQANLLVAKLAAAGGLVAGDLPPVLDLEVSDGLPSSTVVAHALTWLQVVEKKTGVKPLVYTANFMSSVIGTSFGGYPLWVANYGASCPLLPSGWSNWKFWQNADNGNVSGISGGVDTDVFNGTLAQLQALTIQTASGGGTKPPVSDVPATPAHPNDGSQGAVLGDGTPKAAPPQASSPSPNPCSKP